MVLTLVPNNRFEIDRTKKKEGVNFDLILRLRISSMMFHIQVLLQTFTLRNILHFTANLTPDRDLQTLNVRSAAVAGQRDVLKSSTPNHVALHRSSIDFRFLQTSNTPNW